MAMARDNIGALDWRLTESEELVLDEAAAASQGTMVQNIFQTR